MKEQQRAQMVLLVGLVAFHLLPTAAPAAEPSPSSSATNSPSLAEVELRGRVVCLAEEMHRLYQADLPTRHGHLFGFRTSNGDYYTLLRTKMSEALFADERLRHKELLLRGHIFPGTRLFEVTGNLHSVQAGKVCELYYFCDICVIKTISPEPCLCCQGPVELKEVPVE